MPRYQKTSRLDASLKQIKLQQEKAKLAILLDKMPEPKDKLHTPYAEMPPPTDAEMAVINKRLTDAYNRIRAAEEDTKRERLMSFAHLAP
ncbi:MAG: hypothetical protein COA69_00700 [Robiginitomaculum sp.]|nr:MAG: hypothetical protein COA69_00700 [Robiginitomaculum sp.]